MSGTPAEAEATPAGAAVAVDDAALAEAAALAGAAALQAPVHLAPSAWIEHVPFAFWIVDALRPRSLVELGTHHGTSYFAFCQEIRRLGLDARAHAVDTWKGDAHAGFYGEAVYEAVAFYSRAHYAGFSTLHREEFAAALPRFPDGSVDLLHIDGLHSFEAVAADFEAWLPKLSRRGVVLLHDSRVRDRGFGVFRLVEALRSRYPLFEFAHGHGLAVVGVGPEQPPALQALLAAEASPPRKAAVERVFARLGLACRLEMEAKATGRAAAATGERQAAGQAASPYVHARAPARELIRGAFVTPGRRQPIRHFSGEAYRPDGSLCPLSLRPSARAAIKHVPARPPGQASERLGGHHLYAGPLFGIFGHDLVELTGRLWPLLTESFDGIVVQKWRPWAEPFQLKLDQTIATVLDAFGVGFRDVHVVEAPTEIECLTVPEPALHINHFGLPVLGDCFRLIADRYRAPALFAGRGFYLSRTQAGSSRVANEAELEAAAARHGLQVLHPQQLALRTQIALMRQAEALVGTDGSAMHLAAFARPGTRILTFDTRNLMNQRIINELAGLEASTVDVPAGGPVRDIEAHLARLLG